MADRESARSGSRVQFEVTLGNRLPAALAQLYGESGDELSSRRADQEAAAAESAAVRYVRTVWMPGVPQVGDEVEAHPNWEPVEVQHMFWRIDPPGGGDPIAVVVLTDLDEDEVGQGTAQELLVEAGWSVDPDQ